MKKMLLVALMVAMLVCVLTISVSAMTGSESNEYGEITYVEGMTEVNEYDTTSKVVLKNGDGTYTTYPAYYIYNGSTRENMRISLDKLNEKTGENYTSASLIRVEVFENARLNWTYQNCSSLIDVYMPDSVYLHYASFTGCSSLTTIKIPSAATQIPADCFNNCTSLSSIDIPNTVTSLGQCAFQNCTSLSVIKLPEGYTGIIPQDFRKITSWNTERVQVTYIIPKTCTGINSKYSLDNCDVAAIIFTGDANSQFVADVTTDASGWVSKITYENHCDHYYNGIHEEDNNPCVINCARCGIKNIPEKNPVHSEIASISYESFAALGTKTITCLNEGCTHEATEDAPALFVCLGYSAKIGGTKITVGYSVDQASIEAYETSAGKTLKYGVVAYVPNATDIDADNTPINNDLTLKNPERTIFAEVESNTYSGFNFILNGFDEESYGLELIMSAFVYDGEKVYYLGANGQSEVGELITFNDKITEE